MQLPLHEAHIWLASGQGVTRCFGAGKASGETQVMAQQKSTFVSVEVSQIAQKPVLVPSKYLDDFRGLVGVCHKHLHRHAFLRELLCCRVQRHGVLSAVLFAIPYGAASLKMQCMHDGMQADWQPQGWGLL